MVDGVSPNSKIIQFPGPKGGKVSSEKIDPNQQTSPANTDTIKKVSLPDREIYSQSNFHNDLRDFLANPSLNKDLDKLIQLSVDEGIKLRPNIDNLKSIKIETKGNDLVLNLHTDHLKQGYMQVLSDLTLLAKFVDSKIQTETMTANPFESLKVISKPERNLVLTVDQLATSPYYEFGPEFKFIKFPQQNSHLPYLVGPPRLEDVENGAYSIKEDKRNFLGEIALSPAKLETFNPLTEALVVRKPVLGADGKFKIAVRDRALATDDMLFNDFGYAPYSNQLDILLRNNGGLHTHYIELPQPPILNDFILNPPWSKPIREMLNYQPTPGKPKRDFSITNIEFLGYSEIDNLARMDALLIAEQAINPRFEALFAPVFTITTLRAKRKSESESQAESQIQ